MLEMLGEPLVPLKSWIYTSHQGLWELLSLSFSCILTNLRHHPTFSVCQSERDRLGLLVWFASESLLWGGDLSLHQFWLSERGLETRLWNQMSHLPNSTASVFPSVKWASILRPSSWGYWEDPTEQYRVSSATNVSVFPIKAKKQKTNKKTPPKIKNWFQLT